MKLYCRMFKHEIIISNQKPERYYYSMSGNVTEMIDYLVAYGIDLPTAIIVVFGVVNRAEIKPLNSYTCSINY